jgi:hypothetical protein
VVVDDRFLRTRASLSRGARPDPLRLISGSGEVIRVRLAWYASRVDPQERSLERANVVIRAGHAYEVMHQDRRIATEEFANDLRRWGLSVEAEITEYIPGRRGLTPVEWTAIVIGTSVGKRLLDNLVDDLYQAAKDFLRKRLRKGSTRSRLGFKIYGPNGEVLKSWTTDEDQEDDGTA